MPCSNIPPIYLDECTNSENQGPIIRLETDETEKLVYIQYRHKTELELYGKLIEVEKLCYLNGYDLTSYVEIISDNKHINGQKAVIKGFFTYNGLTENATSQTL